MIDLLKIKIYLGIISLNTTVINSYLFEYLYDSNKFIPRRYFSSILILATKLKGIIDILRDEGNVDASYGPKRHINFYLRATESKMSNLHRGTGKESDFRTKNLIATCQRKKIKTPGS